MSCVENVSGGELSPMEEEEEEDGEIPLTPIKDRIAEDILSDIRCDVPLHSGIICWIWWNSNTASTYVY